MVVTANTSNKLIRIREFHIDYVGHAHLELEFHRRLRTPAPCTADASSLHTSFALQTGYEQLTPAIGTITIRENDQMRERFAAEVETRDLLAARFFEGASGDSIAC
jgi:hypothetical protein